ncbi:MAG: hypothetical protein V1774_02170 [Candidatus Eisenbacteria bacterium]
MESSKEQARMPDDSPRWRTASRDALGSADLILIHPAIEADAARIHLGALWPDGDMRRPPEGYAEISSVLFDLRAFCRSELVGRVPQPDPHLPGRIREWMDGIAESWNLADVLAVRDLDFWSFLRGRTITWLHRRMVERRLIEHLADGGELSVLAAGLSNHQRALLRAIPIERAKAIHAEIALLRPPVAEPEETIVEMRLRKLFGLFQDGWHGMRLLLEDMFVHRPKTLLVGDSRNWKRGRIDDGLRGRSDVHLQGVWREGRRQGRRFYYRTDRYDPDVGAMTTGRLAPTYLRHFLFLLAQTSRGYWEVRRIQRQWRALREKPSFQEAFVFEGVSIGEVVLGWMDQAIAEQLPRDVRTTRRETHFLKGTRPAAILIAQQPDDSRALVAAARRLHIPTAGIQLRPFSDWDHAYLLTRRGKPGTACLVDRLCVFSREAKAFLVEQGAHDPSAGAVTGDPRRDWLEERHISQSIVNEEIRRRWGVETGQRVVAVACRSSQCPEVLDWLAKALEGRDDAFVLVHPVTEGPGERAIYERLSGSRGLRWLHLTAGDPFADWLQAVDLLVATSWPETSDAILNRTPVAFVECGEFAGFGGPDPGELIRRVASAGELREIVQSVLARPERMAAGDRWHAFVESVYGIPDRGAAQRIAENVQALIDGR